MSNTNPQKPSDDEAGARHASTLQTSQMDQAQGYLRSLTEDAHIEELQSALEHARRLTKREWTVTVTAEGIDIESHEGDSKRITLPRPKSMDN